MGRVTLPDHENMSTRSPLRVRGTPAQRLQARRERAISEAYGQAYREAAHGMRLNIASGTAVRFEPGQQRTVELVDLSGERQVFGFRGLVNGAVDAPRKGNI